MTELNKYNLYGMNYTAAQMSQKDKVDAWVDEIINLHIYSEVKSFVENNFGHVDGTQYFYYPELNKQVGIINNEETVTICMFKDRKTILRQKMAANRKLTAIIIKEINYDIDSQCDFKIEHSTKSSNKGCSK